MKKYKKPFEIDYDQIMSNLRLQKTQKTYQRQTKAQISSNQYNKEPCNPPIIYSSIIIDDLQKQDCFRSLCYSNLYDQKKQMMNIDKNEFKLYDTYKIDKNTTKINHNKQNIGNTVNCRYLSHTATSQKKMKKIQAKNNDTKTHTPKKAMNFNFKSTIKQKIEPRINQITNKYYRDHQTTAEC